MSIEFRTFPLAVFQNLMHLSAVPPPDARSPCWCGDHAIALTAAVCSVNRNTGCCDRWFHTNNWLSFPPEASSRSSCDHLSPQTWQLRSHKGLRSKTLRQDAFFILHSDWNICQDAIYVVEISPLIYDHKTCWYSHWGHGCHAAICSCPCYLRTRCMSSMLIPQSVFGDLPYF